MKRNINMVNKHTIILFMIVIYLFILLTSAVIIATTGFSNFRILDTIELIIVTTTIVPLVFILISQKGELSANIVNDNLELSFKSNNFILNRQDHQITIKNGSTYSLEMSKDSKYDTKCSISSDNESMSWSINRYDILIDGEIYKFLSNLGTELPREGKTYKFVFNNDIELEPQSEVEKRNQKRKQVQIVIVLVIAIYTIIKLFY